MKKYCTLLLLAISISVSAQTDQFNTILERARSITLASGRVPADSIATWIASYTNKWEDIDYTNPQPSVWPAIRHLYRVKQMALYWADPKSGRYHDTAVWKVISSAIDHWLEKRYQNPNWWQNQIGVPQYWRDILVLTRSALPADQLRGSLRMLEQYQLKGTGANLVWSADLALHDAALTQNAALLEKAVNVLTSEIRIGTGDGIQPDYSYHQHGERLQMYHYGSAFLQDNIRLAWELDKTRWAFPKARIEILTSLLLNGWQWMARGINTVPGTIDRASSRIDFLHAPDLLFFMPYLASLVPEKAAAFTVLKRSQERGTNAVSGYRSYPYSDFTAYHQPQFSFFLKTVSTRTEFTEHINGENKKGDFLNFGDGYFIKTGNEYVNLMPVWDWTHLPGQTNFAGAAKPGRLAFAGSADAINCGVTAADLQSANGSQQFTAHKFWACYKDVVLCLIAGDQSSAGPNAVFTTLNQCRSEGAVTVNKPGNVVARGKSLLTKVKWMHHAGFVYFPLSAGSIELLLDSVSGNWASINSSQSERQVTEKVFLPVFKHQPAAAGYAIVNAETPRIAQNIAAAPSWKIFSNTTACQAAGFENKTFMAVFRRPATIKLGAAKLTANRAVIVVIDAERLYLSDPLHLGGSLKLGFNGKYYSCELPADGTTVGVKR